MKVITADFSVGRLKKDQENALLFLKTLPGFVSAVFRREWLGIYGGKDHYYRVFVCVFDPAKISSKEIMKIKYKNEYLFRSVKTNFGVIG